MSLGKGINLSTGFDLNAKSPLDNRQVFETIAERDALPDINRYEGLFCYVKETQKNYQFINGTWKDFMATSSGGSSSGGSSGSGSGSSGSCSGGSSCGGSSSCGSCC